MNGFYFLSNFDKRLEKYYRQAIEATEKELNKKGIITISKKAFDSNGNRLDHAYGIWFSCTIKELQTFHYFTDVYVKPNLFINP